MKRKQPLITSPAESKRLHSQFNKKCTRGEGVYYSERKHQIALSITDSSRQILEEIAISLSLSKSEVLERLLRKKPDELKTFLML